MNRHFDELRETRLTDETRAQFSLLTRAVLGGDQVATKRIADSLGDYLADGNALADLVRNTLEHADALQQVLTDLIWTEAAELAEAEVAQQERARAESRDENAVARATAHLEAA
jgi:hypothetical protein